MSAGGLSYSGLSSNRRVTLPSVEMWNTNMNILKDPPKGVYTRRIDKVGDTQNTLMETDASGDRACEYIQVYARGVNPMVSVSYDNFGNNGGQNTMANNISFYQNQVRYPYRVETLRPPILRQEDVLPLSRLPRVWYHAETNPQFPEFRQQHGCTEQKSSIVETPLKTPDPGGNLASGPMKEMVSDGEYSNHATNDTLLRSVDEGFRSTGHDKDLRGATDPSSGTRANIMHIGAETNRSTITRQQQAERGSTDSLGQIDRNRRIYEAFSTKSMSMKGKGVDDNDHDHALSKKSINANLLYIQAQTNNRGLRQGSIAVAPELPIKAASKASPHIGLDSTKAFDGFADGLNDRMDHLVEESSIVPTRSMIYRRVETPKESFESNERSSSTLPKDHIIENPLHTSAHSQKGKERGRIMVDPTVLAKASTHDQIIHVDHGGRRTLADHAETGFFEASNRPDPVHETILHPQAPARASFGHFTRQSSENNLDTIRTQPRLRGSTESARSMPDQGVNYLVDPVLRSKQLDRSIPHYVTHSNIQGMEGEQDRSDLRHLDRRTLMIEHIPTNEVSRYSDMYDQNIQSRTPRNQRQRLPMEGFLHNHSALPTINQGSNHVPVTDDRVNLRKKAFDAFMERTYVPPPIEYSR